jgi:hypothetical protein
LIKPTPDLACFDAIVEHTEFAFQTQLLEQLEHRGHLRQILDSKS